MIQVLSKFFYFILDFPFILLLIELIFCFSFKKRKLFYVRLLILFPYLYLFHPALSEISPWAKWTNFNHLPIFNYESINITYIIIFAITILILFFLFDVSIWKLLFMGSASYALQNFSHNLCELIRTTLLNGDPSQASGKDQQFIYYIIKTIIFIIVITGAYFTFIKKYKESEKDFVDNRLLIIFVTTTVSIISVFNYWTYAENMRNTAFYIMMLIINILLLVLQFSFYNNYRILNEKEITENILHTQIKQQAINKENMEIINRKCHDLKYQVEALKHLDESKNRDKVIEDLETSIKNFDSKVECGNKILDVILTEKNRLCENSHIEFSCIADGKLLSFIDDNDLYILFSNALDNAIEALKKVDDYDNRILSLLIEKKNDLTYIVIENYYQEDVIIENNLPVTTKNNKNYHGFGTKSIKHIVEKYDGNMVINASNHHFKLNIIFFK